MRTANAATFPQPQGGQNNQRVVGKIPPGWHSGSAVHQIKISWPHHVFVSKNFKVTGAIG
jgi:hypothetical protein